MPVYIRRQENQNGGTIVQVEFRNSQGKRVNLKHNNFYVKGPYKYVGQVIKLSPRSWSQIKNHSMDPVINALYEKGYR